MSYGEVVGQWAGLTFLLLLGPILVGWVAYFLWTKLPSRAVRSMFRRR